MGRGDEMNGKVLVVELELVPINSYSSLIGRLKNGKTKEKEEKGRIKEEPQQLAFVLENCSVLYCSITFCELRIWTCI